MEKSQAKGIESFPENPKDGDRQIGAWKNPKQRELKGLGHLRRCGFGKNWCMEKSQAKGIEREKGRLIGEILPRRCMEKSQAKGIERPWLVKVCIVDVGGCMEKSQAKGIESPGVRCVDVSSGQCGAWKNPKQRELKVVFVAACFSVLNAEVHGKIPSKGN